MLDNEKLRWRRRTTLINKEISSPIFDCFIRANDQTVFIPIAFSFNWNNMNDKWALHECYT